MGAPELEEVAWGNGKKKHWTTHSAKLISTVTRITQPDWPASISNLEWAGSSQEGACLTGKTCDGLQVFVWHPRSKTLYKAQPRSNWGRLIRTWAAEEGHTVRWIKSAKNTGKYSFTSRFMCSDLKTISCAASFQSQFARTTDSEPLRPDPFLLP